ncbi:hypothetical protein DV451_002056 [Geotrichum candidum]|uniref:Ubiquitin-like domain-containing protein n=1 Tax=Geotrichum candidum TaxID=1173061 RepID=A0A9P5G814_GEOCN|nr:hypothetical protein DV451_002056 [Geotrichum candidum]KAI9212384.1 hypothetical protein DS838_002715 [Geotrichum bryndzae]KAF5108457.1 hypothetical protein DV453_002243 [Geotrichum candidum]KAF5115388.1 hypothetical protein DV454_002318 [Geotrichum candidum]KAF5116844.1 hypothetical protein DV452_002520 [Geotrichum candidum]
MPSLDLSIKSVSGNYALPHSCIPTLYILANRPPLAYALQVDSSKTVAHIKALLSDQDPTIHPTASSLVYAGKSLEDHKTLDSYNIPNDSTLHYSSGNSSSTSPAAPSVPSSPSKGVASLSPTNTSPISKPSPARKSRKRCSAKNCISAPLRNIGDCSYCEGHFCSKHRLLEQHQCIGLKNCKQQLHDKNAVKLQEQQTVANKV